MCMSFASHLHELSESRSGNLSFGSVDFEGER